MELLAIEWGIPSDKYWLMTFNEIMMQVSASKSIYDREMKDKALFDYNQAHLLAFAFNQPEKMPKFEEIYNFANNSQTISEKVPQATIDLAKFEKWSKAINRTREKNGGD